MGQALAITRTEHTAEALREFAAKSRDGAQVRRLLAIALILEGRSRTEAANHRQVAAEAGFHPTATAPFSPEEEC